jgi:hypothetical protein
MDQPSAVKDSEKAFKRVCRMYVHETSASAPAKGVEMIWKFKKYIDFEDFVLWKDQVGIKKGVVFDEDKTIIFEEWPTRPHDQIVDIFNSQLMEQFSAISPTRHTTLFGSTTEQAVVVPLVEFNLMSQMSVSPADRNNLTRHEDLMVVPSFYN